MTEISYRQKFDLVPLISRARSPAIVFGHADADGHLAAEQTRNNLEIAGVRVTKLVVGAETWNYNFWERSFLRQNFDEYKLVVAVDIAFNFRDPQKSLTAVLETVDCHPSTQFIIIDHHPLKLPETPRENLWMIEVNSPYRCCIGRPSDELMVLAALCDQSGNSRETKVSTNLRLRATGIRRAAADVHGVAGSGLLRLLRNRRWDFFDALGQEPSEYHQTARGRRRRSSPNSPLLDKLNEGLYA